MIKRTLLCLSLSLLTSALYALDCGNLGITIINNTGGTCELKSSIFIYGYYNSNLPRSIPNGATAPTFYLQQDSDGIGAEFDYRCDNNKVAIFYSFQSYCGIYAGTIVGQAYTGNDLVAEYRREEGSYWNKLPGQITWTLHQ